MEINHGNEIYESAYWAGRMIGMADSKITWDIAKEIAKELQSLRDQLKEKHQKLQQQKYDNKNAWKGVKEVCAHNYELKNEIINLKEQIKQLKRAAGVIDNPDFNEP